MESQELIDALRKQIGQVEAQGSQQIQVAALRVYLDALERDPGVSQEYRNQDHAGKLNLTTANV